MLNTIQKGPLAVGRSAAAKATAAGLETHLGNMACLEPEHQGKTCKDMQRIYGPYSGYSASLAVSEWMLGLSQLSIAVTTDITDKLLR